ncbi:MAG: hypothetical protein CVU05_11285 [Bacteroidetes bacterium HGW-Bacteroidetes-21]|jgi:Zn-dependent protease with chaperone function|nr:MAG: hypothetical protein CVU05_11285 [Bacteroidetes bacterium HGW-Bacteroidetes-21]
MIEKDKLLEPLLESATEYGKTTYELIKLKILDKSSDVISSIIPHSVVFVLFTSFLIFLNLGLAFWLGQIFGSTYLGFFVVAAFYGVVGILLHFFFHNWIKKSICNAIIKQVLN